MKFFQNIFSPYTSLALLMGVIFICVFYGYTSNYFLNDDLPAHVAVLSELDNFGIGFYGNPYMHEVGLPDFHAGPYYLFVYLINKVINIHIVDLGLNLEIEKIISAFLIAGFATTILFLLSFIALCRVIEKGIVFLLLGLIIFLVTPDLPLLRWAGNLSLHGITYQFYYPQFFGITLSILILYLNQQYLKSNRFSFITASATLNVLLLLSHILTGLLMLAISMAQLIVFNKKILKQKIFIFGVFLSVPLLSLTWPFFPVYLTLQETNALALLLFLYVAILSVALLIQTIYDKHNNVLVKIQFFLILPGIEKFVTYSNIVLLAYLLYNFGNTSEYLRFTDVMNWWVLLLPLMPGLLMIFSKKTRRDPILLILILWSAGCLFLYSLGASNIYEFKVYWRFLFLAKLPLALLVAYAWHFIYLETPLLFKRLFPVLIFLLCLGFTLQIQTISTSSTANYFKNLPIEYEVAQFFKDTDNAIILSDPFTSYFIAGLSNNKVFTVDVDRTCDYDHNIANERLELYKQFINEPNKKNISVINSKHSIDYVVINKALSMDKNNSKMYRQTLDFTFLQSFEDNMLRLGASEIYNSNNFIIYELHTD